MCLATVFIEDDGQREQVMQDVAWIKPVSRRGARRSRGQTGLKEEAYANLRVPV